MPSPIDARRLPSVELIFAVALFLLGCGILRHGLSLKVGTISVPDAGFFPFLAGATLASLAALQLALSVRTGSSEAKESRPAVHWKKAAALIASLIIYAVILETIGFLLATSLLAIAVMRIAHPTPWPFILLTSFVSSVGSYLFFSKSLGVGLPWGALF